MDGHRLNRARLQMLLDALEADLRAYLETWVVPYVTLPDALEPYYSRALELQIRAVDTGAPTSVLEWMYLGDVVALLSRHRDRLPDDVVRVVANHGPGLDALTPVRNRVAHGRPLLHDDADKVADTTEALVKSGLDFPNLKETVRHLTTDPAWAALFEPRNRPIERVLHNLPTPDFDETSLIGRSKENRDLLKLLTARRSQVITVVGEGGIGKTALAVKVLYDLVDDPECPFEAVFWASAKTERLTADGIERIASAAAESGSIAGQLSEPIGDATGVSALASFLEGVPSLIVVDNVETADSNEILDLVDSLPSSASFLFTSRVGLGQLERRFPLKALEPSQSSRLLRRLARSRGLEHIASAGEEAVLKMVEQLRNSPLAIKWFVVAVEGGANSDLLLRNQNILLEFCLRTVFDQLSTTAVLVLRVLSAANRALPFPEIAVLAGIDVDPVRVALQELQRAALLDLSTRSPADPTQLYSLTATATQYVARLAPAPPDLRARVRAVESDFLESEEDRLKQQRLRALGPATVVSRNPGDRAVVHLLSSALSLSRDRKIDEARAAIARAESLAPEFFEVARVHAFIESPHNVALASELYERALALAESEHRPIVAYYYSGHLARQARQLDLALDMALEADQALRLPDTAIRLAETHKYRGEFEAAWSTFTGIRDAVTGRQRLGVVSNIINTAKRWSEHLLAEEHRPAEALAKALRGIEVGEEALAEGIVDRRILDEMLGCAQEGFNAARWIDDLQRSSDEVETLLSLSRSHVIEWQYQNDWGYLVGRIRAFASRPGLSESYARSAWELLGTPEASSERYEGTVVNFNADRSFGFLTWHGRPNIFIHASQLLSPDDRVFLVPGAPVSFEAEPGAQGPVACRVAVDTAASLGLAPSRTGYVRRLDYAFAFVRDDLTGAQVFAPSRAFGTAWSAVAIGRRVEFGLAIGERGPKASMVKFAVAPSAPQAD